MMKDRPFAFPRFRERRSNREVCLPHGLGCDKHDNCFTCPEWPDCTEDYHKGDSLAQVWRFTDGIDYFRTKEEMA